MAFDRVYVVEYASLGLATKSTGISWKCITDAINWKQKTAGGYILKFADITDNNLIREINMIQRNK